MATAWEADRGEPPDADPPIGPPLPNVLIRVVDPGGVAEAAGEVGELHIGGAGVARGYLRRPELTADRFLTEGSGPTATRWYRTGDLVRARPDRVLAFVGDEQAVSRAFAGRADLALAAGDLEGGAPSAPPGPGRGGAHRRPPRRTCSLEALASLVSHEGRWDKAARLFGAAEDVRERFGVARPPRLEPAYREDVTRAREAMGQDAWEDARRQGGQLPVADALSYARKGRGPRRRPLIGWDSLTPAERGGHRPGRRGPNLTNPQTRTASGCSSRNEPSSTIWGTSTPSWASAHAPSWYARRCVTPSASRLGPTPGAPRADRSESGG